MILVLAIIASVILVNIVGRINKEVLEDSIDQILREYIVSFNDDSPDMSYTFIAEIVDYRVYMIELFDYSYFALPTETEGSEDDWIILLSSQTFAKHLVFLDAEGNIFSLTEISKGIGYKVVNQAIIEKNGSKSRYH